MEWDNIEILLADVIQLLKNILLITYVIPALSRNLSKNSDLYIIDI